MVMSQLDVRQPLACRVVSDKLKFVGHLNAIRNGASERRGAFHRARQL